MEEPLSPELSRLLNDLLVEERFVIAARNAGLYAEVDAAQVRIADILRQLRAPQH